MQEEGEKAGERRVRGREQSAGRPFLGRPCHEPGPGPRSHGTFEGEQKVSVGKGEATEERGEGRVGEGG